MDIIKILKILAVAIVGLILIFCSLSYYYVNFNKKLETNILSIDITNYSQKIKDKYDIFLEEAKTKIPKTSYADLVSEVNNQLEKIESINLNFSKFQTMNISKKNKENYKKVVKEIKNYESVLKQVSQFLSTVDSISKKDYPGYYVLGQKMINDYFDLDKEVQFKYNGKDVKIAFLTFDDGPSKNTDKVLDILDENDVKGTFFVLGTNLDTYSDEARRIIDEGHTLASHGYSHNTSKIVKDDNMLDEANQTYDILKNDYDYDCKLLRIPTGSTLISQKQEQSLIDGGYKIIDWTVDSRDWEVDNADEVYENVEMGTNSRIEVVLFHEKDLTIKTLQRNIDFLQEEGYYLLPIPKNYMSDFKFGDI